MRPGSRVLSLRWTATGLAFGALCAAAACGSKKPTAKLSYAQSAEAAYEAALAAYRDDDCTAAEPAFRDVRRRYPYSKYAPLAELRAADCLFKDDKFPEAIEGYRRFVEVRASHPKVPYARYQLARAYFEQIPSDWWVLPPGHERDQAATRQARRYLAEFVGAYPKHRLRPQAEKHLRTCQAKLAEHELYAARFYLKRGQPLATLLRLRTLFRAYPDTPHDGDARTLFREALAEARNGKSGRVALEILELPAAAQLAALKPRATALSKRP